MAKPLLIGIAGGTGSGKTTLACALEKFLGTDRSRIITQDSYYKDRSSMDFAKRENLNFDEPAAFDLALLVEHLKRLKMGQAIEMPIYDYITHTRTQEKKTIPPVDFIILEGILLLAIEDVRALLDLKVYVDAPPEVRFQRRFNRDLKDRGRTEESVMKQYLLTVLPMHYKYIEPSRKFADLVVSGEEPVVKSWKKIEQKLKNSEVGLPKINRPPTRWTVRLLL